MTNNFNIRVEGLESSLNRLGRLAQNNKDEAKQAITETAINIERKAKQNLASRSFEESTGGIAQSAYILYTADGYGSEVGFNAHYAPYHEYGTGDLVDVDPEWGDYAMQFIGKGIRKVNIKPSPYFHPAINSELDNLRRKLEQSMRP